MYYILGAQTCGEMCGWGRVCVLWCIPNNSPPRLYPVGKKTMGGYRNTNEFPCCPIPITCVSFFFLLFLFFALCSPLFAPPVAHTPFFSPSPQERGTRRQFKFSVYSLLYFFFFHVFIICGFRWSHHRQRCGIWMMENHGEAKYIYIYKDHDEPNASCFFFVL